TSSARSRAARRARSSTSRARLSTPSARRARITGRRPGRRRLACGGSYGRSPAGNRQPRPRRAGGVPAHGHGRRGTPPRRRPRTARAEAAGDSRPARAGPSRPTRVHRRRRRHARRHRRQDRRPAREAPGAESEPASIAPLHRREDPPAVTRLAFLCLVTTCYLAGAAFAAAPRVDAHAWLVADAASGDVLAQHDATVRVPIASITKLMTVLVVLDHLKLGHVVTVDPQVTSAGESLGLRPGEELTVRDLVKGALIQSANDAADALALAVAPSFPSFANLMNAKARALGLRDTSFVRPDGLDAPGEYSTARDVMRL